MDTKNFIVTRAELLESLQARRERSLGSHPFRMADDYGVRLPAWARLGLSFFTPGGAISRVLEFGLPLAVPLLFRKKESFANRLVRRIFSAGS